MAEFDIIKPAFPPREAPLSAYWPHLASVELSEESLYAACVKKAKVVGVSADYQSVSINLNGTVYNNVPVWIHTDVGARTHSMQDVDNASATNYFKDGGLLFPLPECVPLPTKGHRTEAIDKEYWSIREIDGKVVFLASWFQVRAMGGYVFGAECVSDFTDGLATIKPASVAIDPETGAVSVDGGSAMDSFEYVQTGGVVKVICEDISWYHLITNRRYYIPIECVLGTDGTDVELCDTVFHTEVFKLHEFRSTHEEHGTIPPEGMPDFDYTKQDVVEMVQMFRKITYPPIVFVLMLPNISDVLTPRAVIGIERNLGRKASDTQIRDVQNGTMYYNVDRFVWPTYRPYGEVSLLFQKGTAAPYEFVSVVCYRDLLSGVWIRLPEYDAQGVPTTPITEFFTLTDACSQENQPTDEQMMAFRSNGGVLREYFFQDPGLIHRPVPPEPGEEDDNYRAYTRYRYGDGAHYALFSTFRDYVEDEEGAIIEFLDPYWALSMVWPGRTSQIGREYCVSLSGSHRYSVHPNVLFGIEKENDIGERGWFVQGTRTSHGTGVSGDTVEWANGGIAVNYNPIDGYSYGPGEHYADIPVCFHGSLGYTQSREYNGRNNQTVTLEVVVSFEGTGETSYTDYGPYATSPKSHSFIDASGVETYTLSLAVNNGLPTERVIEFPWIETLDRTLSRIYYEGVGYWLTEGPERLFRAADNIMNAHGDMVIGYSYFYPSFLYDSLSVYVVSYTTILDRETTTNIGEPTVFIINDFLRIEGVAVTIPSPTSVCQFSAIDALEDMCVALVEPASSVLYADDPKGEYFRVSVSDQVILLPHDPRIPLA